MHSVKMAVSTCRSGSTALILAFSQNPQILCYYQPVKAGLRARGKPDYGVFSRTEPVLHIMAKETLGHRSLEECVYRVFPGVDEMRLAKPLFLLREPMETYSAWKHFGWGSLSRFIASWRNLLEIHAMALEHQVPHLMVSYLELTLEPRQTLGRICDLWEMPLIEEMINWTTGYEENDRILYPDPTHGNYDYAHGHLTSSRSFAPKRRPLGLDFKEVRQLEPLREEYQVLTGDLDLLPIPA